MAGSLLSQKVDPPSTSPHTEAIWQTRPHAGEPVKMFGEADSSRTGLKKKEKMSFNRIFSNRGDGGSSVE